MSWLIGIIKEGMLTFTALVLIWLILNHVQIKQPKISAVWCLFSLYLAVLWMIVGMPDLMYIRLDVSGNLIPFRGMIDDLKNSALNILLFLPMGFFLPLFRMSYRRMRITLGAGFGISAAIEFFQIFTYRATDINDLMTNTLGTAVGFLLWTLLASRKEPLTSESTTLPLLFGVTVCVMFFIHPFLYRLSWALF